MADSLSPQLKSLLSVLKGPLFEKNISYMYVDTVGKITVGVGHNITSHGDLFNLPFKIARCERHPVIVGDKGIDKGISIIKTRGIGMPATSAEKQNDYDFLLKHKRLGIHDPEHLRKYTTLQIDISAVDKLFTDDLNESYKIARAEFGAAFDKFSDTRKAALIDIAFNAGGFKSFQDHFVPAIKGSGPYAGKTESERWKEAAKHSRRGKVNGTRNSKIAEWLNSTGVG